MKTQYHLLFILLAFYSFSVSAEIYKWTDKNGSVHYTNQKPENKKYEMVELNKSLNTYTSQNISPIKQIKKITKFKPMLTSTKSNTPQALMFFTTSWCGYCKQARKYFNRNKIKFKEYNIESNVNARAIYDRLGGKGVPFLVQGKNKMHGFSIAQFKKFYIK